MQHRKLVSGLLMVALLLAGWAVPGSGAPAAAASSPDEAAAKIESQVLQEIAATGQTDFFVWMAEKADLSPAYQLKTKAEKGQFVFDTLVETAERTQKDLRRYLDAQGAIYETFYIANKILVQGGNQTLVLNIAARPDVGRITANHQYQLEEPVITPNPPAHVTAVEPNITFIKADQVWAMGVTGAGMVLAGNDTGLDETHPTIARHYRGCLNPPSCTSWDHNYNWWDATGTYPTNPYDGMGHGTHTTGTMVGDDGGSNQIGVAPGAQTIHCKNMTDGGSGSDTTFTTCFEWDLAPWDLNHQNPEPSMAPDAVNNSWGYWGGGQNQFRDEILALQAAGILVEVSAGNEGPSCSTLRSPGDYQEVLTTGSVDHIGQTFPGIITVTGTWSTSRGPSDLDGNYFPDIMAPGNGVRSALPGNQYDYWGGTSMAGPHATALVGLMWSACPSLVGRVEDTIQIIKDTAGPLTGQYGSNCGGDYTVGPNNDWGMGTIDALAAVQAVIAQCTGIGQLDGYVRDAGTTAPLEGATVTAEWENGGQWQDSTDATGYYTQTLPNGTYTVTATFFGYLPATVTGVEVITDEVTTQDLNLTPSPQYVVSGTVAEAGTSLPLLAQVEALDSPLSPVWTNPSTGFYSMTVPQGTYTFRVTADQHQPAERVVIADHDQTQDFALEPLPCILLVDDDNNAPDVRPYFTAALDNLGYDYNVFDVGGGGNNGPDLAGLAGYSIVLWFSGDKFGSSAGPNGTDETNLAAYLDGGGKLFLSSQDYLYDFGLTTFGQNYLGIGSYTDDTGNATTKYGLTGDPIGDGLGPYPLTYPSGFSDYGDIVNAGSGASVAFRSSATGGNNLDVDKDGGTWQTVFFGTSWVPIYNNNAANGQQVLERIITWFGGCECYPVSDASFTWMPPDPVTGEDVTFSGTASGSSPLQFQWDFGDGETGTGHEVVHAFTDPGGYTVTMTATNACGSDTTSDVVTVLPVVCEPVQILDVLTATAGCTVTYSADLAGDPPFVYDWDFGAFGSSTEPEPVVDYGQSGTYSYTLTVTNCDSQNSDTASGQVTVVCAPPCEPVDKADFAWTPITPTVGQEATFTGTATGTAPISFTWDFGDGGGGTGQVASHTYAAADSYTVVMTATNCDEAWATATHTVVVIEEPLVCTDVTGVELTLVTTGTLYPDDEVAFSAALTPDGLSVPYHYTLNAGPVMTSTANPLAFTLTFTAPGTHTAEIAIWNCAMTVPLTGAMPVVISEPAARFYIYLPLVVKN
jgi:PKD repeat protein